MEGSPATDSGGVGASLRRRSNSSKGGMADARDPGAATANPRPLTEQSSLLSSISPRSDAVNVPAPSSATLPAREENQQQADRSTLLQHFVTVPTASRKLQGLKNLALCALTFLPYLCSLAVRFIMGKLGVSEHRWKGVPNDQPLSPAGQRQLESVAKELLASTDQDIATIMTTFRRKHADRLSSAAAAAGAAPLLPRVPSDRSGASTPIGAFAGGEGSSSGSGAKDERTPVLPVAANGQSSSGIASGTNPGSTSSNDIGSTSVPETILNLLQDTIHAVEIVTERQGIALIPSLRQQLYTKYAKTLQTLAQLQAVNLQDVFREFRHIGKKYLKKVSKLRPGIRKPVVVKEYVFECLMLHSLRVPTQRTNPVMQLGDGRDFVETTTLVSLQPGLEFLRLQGEQYSEHIVFMERFHRLRPSDVKKEWVAQAMTVNARTHTLALRHTDQPNSEVAWHLRSGAFAVHGRHPKGSGLSSLIAAQQSLAAESDPERRAALLEKFKYKSAAAIEPEVRIRSVCCVAQALPVIVAGLQRAITQKRCWEAAARARTFLHVQQSLLSDLHSAEHGYLEDTKGALDLLSSRVEIRFTHRPIALVAVDRATQRITLSLDSASVPDDVLPPDVGTREETLSRPYRLQALLFSQGVNVLQDIGFFTVGDSEITLQDSLNSEAMEALNSYAQRAGRVAGRALAALNRHFSPGATRQAKDTDAIWLVCQATEEVGGMRAVNCKSGKDRTAIELSVTMARQAVVSGVLTEGAQRPLQAAMQSGLSYALTGENNGMPNAYAFSELELVAMPPGWRPIWKLCGKVMS